MIERINIPADRVRVLLSCKSAVERGSKAELNVTMDGEVSVEGDDAFLIYRCLQVIKAVGRGFAPSKAEKLFDDP
jgi:rRNA processing protein Krr1/Pno1